MFRPQNRAAAHMGMDAVVHGDLPGHQHIVQSLRAMSGISKIFPGREMLPVQYQQIGSQTSVSYTHLTLPTICSV